MTVLKWKIYLGLMFSSIFLNAQVKNDLENKSSLSGNDSAVRAWIKENNVPVLGIGIIKGGELQQVKVYGELKKGIAAPYNTIFNVASLTKPVTAIVALKLVSQKKWDLDEPLYKYWTDPDIAGDTRNKLLTTRIVLSHQTGFPNWRWNHASKKLAFEFDPGLKYQYSGEGFEYLRKAMEKKFNKTLDQMARELIFYPLKMEDTKFFWDNTDNEARFAPGYDIKGNIYPTNYNKSASAADDLLTTIEDYGKFLVAILNGNALSKEITSEMLVRQVKTKENKYFGLGMEIYDLGNGEFALSHGGSDQGCQTLVFIFPKSREGLLIFTNVDDGYKVYAELLKLYLGEKGKKIIEIEMK